MNFSERPQATDNFKYSNWRLSNRGTASVHHQEKNWFDSFITNWYLNWLCYDVYPNKKVGLVWDQAPQHISKKVENLTEKLKSEGKLVLVLIPKSLTSIVQLYDLVANKYFKKFIQNEYYRWRV